MHVCVSHNSVNIHMNLLFVGLQVYGNKNTLNVKILIIICNLFRKCKTFTGSRNKKYGNFIAEKLQYNLYKSSLAQQKELGEKDTKGGPCMYSSSTWNTSCYKF